MALLSRTCKIPYNETRSYVDDSNDEISFILRVGGIERTYMRSASGRETLVQQTNFDIAKAKELEHKISPTCLFDEVDNMLWDDGIEEYIRDCVVPSIYKEAMELHRYREEIGGRGFLIVTEVEFLEETWITEVLDHDDSQDHRQIQTEQDSCAVCLEALDESNTTGLLCSHSFHRDCLFQWLGHDLSCPVCRYDDL